MQTQDDHLWQKLYGTLFAHAHSTVTITHNSVIDVEHTNHNHSLSHNRHTNVLSNHARFLSEFGPRGGGGRAIRFWVRGGGGGAGPPPSPKETLATHNMYQYLSTPGIYWTESDTRFGLRYSYVHLQLRERVEDLQEVELFHTTLKYRLMWSMECTKNVKAFDLLPPWKTNTFSALLSFMNLWGS